MRVVGQTMATCTGDRRVQVTQQSSGAVDALTLELARVLPECDDDELRFRQRVTAGMVSINNSTSGAEAHLPFGGNGKSGNGSRQSGIWVLDQFTRWQSMNWDYAGKLQKAQMDIADVDADLDFRL